MEQPANPEKKNSLAKKIASIAGIVTLIAGIFSDGDKIQSIIDKYLNKSSPPTESHPQENHKTSNNIDEILNKFSNEVDNHKDREIHFESSIHPPELSNETIQEIDAKIISRIGAKLSRERKKNNQNVIHVQILYAAQFYTPGINKIIAVIKARSSDGIILSSDPIYFYKAK